MTEPQSTANHLHPQPDAIANINSHPVENVVPSKRARTDERRVTPKLSTQLSTPDSFGNFNWKEPVLLDCKRNEGDQPLTLKQPREPVEFDSINPFDRLDNEEFNKFAQKHNMNLKHIDVDALADELCKRQNLLLGKEFDNKVWIPLLQPCNSGDQKKILAFMALTVFCCMRDEQVDLNLAVALIYCISRVSAENIRSKLKKLLKTL